MSFTRAAKELNYAQSSVTGQIRALETELGIELFDRLGGRIQLTDAGRRLLGYAEQILGLVSDAEADLAGSGEPAGSMLIGTMESITSYRLPPLLEFFHRRYPRVQLSLRPSLCAETCQALRQGTLDVGFLIEEVTEHEGLESVVLAREELVLLASPKHRLAAAGQLDIEQIRGASVLAAESGCAYRDLFEDQLADPTGEPFAFLEFGTIEAIKRGVAAGLGISLLPRTTAEDPLASGELIVLPWRPPFSVYTQLAWRRGKRLSREQRLFVDETIRQIQEEDAAAYLAAAAR